MTPLTDCMYACMHAVLLAWQRCKNRAQQGSIQIHNGGVFVSVASWQPESPLSTGASCIHELHSGDTIFISVY